MSKAFRIRPSGKFSRIFFCVVGMSLVLSMSAWAAEASSVELREGVLIAPDQGIVYFMNPAGGIDGVDLATANVVWQTKEAHKPLLIEENLLVAQGESENQREILIATFDTRRSGQIEQTMSVDLPQGVLGRIDGHLKGSLRTRAVMQGGQVLMNWEAETRFPRGISPLMREQLSGPALDGQQLRAQLPTPRSYSNFAGAALLDLNQGIAKSVAPADLALAKQAQSVGSGLREVVGASLRVAEQGRQFFSNDGQHVLVSVRRAPEAGGPAHQWTIFTLSGDRIGQVAMDVAAAPFLVLDGQLITTLPMRAERDAEDWNVLPLRLQTFDLSSGLAKGSWEIRDLEFRGPFPQ